MKSLPLAVALAAATASCASVIQDGQQFAMESWNAADHAIQSAIRAPELSPVETPAPLTGGRQDTIPQPGAMQVAARAPNSLWQQGSRNFFRDQRASQRGDILTVKIKIDDSAELSNNSARTRTSNTELGVSNLFGIETSLGGIFGGGFDPGNLINADAASAANGQGSINREEKIELTVAALIVEALPNGNFVIAGRQQVRINGELRQLTVTGVIRPTDIAADNSIRHDQIAEARIDYGGRGQITDIQRPRYGQLLADTIAPW